MNFCSAADELLLESIIGFDSFAGCDNVSTFSSWGKAKPLKLVTKSYVILKPFPCLVKKSGQLIHWSANQKCLYVICIVLLGSTVDNVGYRMYCKSAGKVSCDTLPPTNDALHISRANYEAYICWQSLVVQQEQLDTIYHGSMHNGKENCLTLKLMECKPAPNEVRKLIPYFYT